MIRTRLSVFAATTILAMMVPGMASAQSTPAFRVPLGSAPTSSNVAATYAWLEQIGNCSTTCGTGTRTTSYQCQNIAEYDYAGAGYGLPEATSMCTSTIGASPSDVGSTCTVYSGCGYDWVKPPVEQKAIPLDSNPTGRIGCGYVNQKFSPVCQRSGGSGGTITMAAGDHRFCSADRPDYNEVAAGVPDALGYDRNVVQTNVCAPQDHDWMQSGFGSWSSDCSTNATRTQVVSCKRRFDGKTYGTAAEEDTRCSAGRPAASETSARYGSCSYSYSYGTWSGWSSGCDTSATRDRTATCMRSNEGGSPVAESECTSRSIAKEAVRETSAQYGSCTYAYRTGNWSGYNSSCSANASRTRDVWCERSNNDRVADSECSAKGLAKPVGSESAAQYGGCTYSWAQGGFGAWSSGCSANATRTQAVWCRRDVDGATVSDASCTAPRPASSQTSAQYGSCTYAIEDSGAGACNGSTRPHYWTCRRQQTGETVDSGTYCNRPNPTYEACPDTYSLRDAGVGACQSNNQAPHYWGCIRDRTGEQVDSATYCGRQNPTYEACSFPYTYTIRDAGVGACNGSTKPHYWGCTRDQTGEGVDSGTYCGRPNPTYETCGDSYTLRDAGLGACQTNNQAPRYWSCTRDRTGEGVDSATYCGRANPTYETCTYPWTYRLEDAGLGACNGNNKPHYWNCIREQDGARVDSAAYCGRSNPTYEPCGFSYTLSDGGVGSCQTNNQAPHYWNCRRNETGEMVDSGAYCGRSNPTYDACTYPWTYTPGYGGFSTCSGDTQSQTINSCTRADGTGVDPSTCTNAGHPATRTQSCTAAPTQDSQHCVLRSLSYAAGPNGSLISITRSCTSPITGGQVSQNAGGYKDSVAGNTLPTQEIMREGGNRFPAIVSGNCRYLGSYAAGSSPPPGWNGWDAGLAPGNGMVNHYSSCS